MNPSPLLRLTLCVVGLLLAAGDACAVESVPFDGIPPAEPSFRRHVIPLLSRAGCSARECHGSFAGRGGFRLSLFGYDFEADHHALTGDADGDSGEIRVHPEAPAKSLLILKPSEQVRHKGKERIKKDSWEYNLLLRWITAGAKNDAATSPEFDKLEVFPHEIVFNTPGQVARIKVVVTWKDGTREDVTPFTRFRSNDDAIATVSDGGFVKCLAKGDTEIVAFYDNGVAPVPVMLPVSDFIGAKYPQIRTSNKVDELAIAKLRKLGIVPSGICTDAEFLRRASLDVAGTLPTPDQVLKFLADKSPDKRAKKINELLDSPGYAAWWATKLCDFTGNSARELFSEGVPDLNGEYAREWWNWIDRRLSRNEPYDKLAAGIILGTSRSSPEQSYKDYVLEMVSYLRHDHPADFAGRETMPYFWARKNVQKPEDRALSFAHAFLGVRIECAQCHKHPFDQWTKADYLQFQTFFDHVRYDSNIRKDDDVNYFTVTKELRAQSGGPDMMRSKDALAGLLRQRIDAGEVIPIYEVYIATRHPRNTTAAANTQAYAGRVLTPKLLGGEEVLLKDFADPREPLVRWLRSKDNPYFARVFINRVWAAYFHRGLIEPADDMNLANPPVNPELMDYLANAFINSGYDMKALHRLILNSDTYQRSWRPNATNENDERNFSRFVIRRLPAEVILDAMTLATLPGDRQPSFLNDIANRQIGPNVAAFGLAEPIGKRNLPDYAVVTFGKPAREMNCDCERATVPTLLQTLYTRNDPEMLARIESQKSETPAWITELRRTNGAIPAGTLDALINEVFLRTVSRPPTFEELQSARADIAKTANPIDGLRDLLWVMLNTREFAVNH
jgi:hypothetical protein